MREHAPHPVEATKRERILAECADPVKGVRPEDHPGMRYWLCRCGQFHPSEGEG